MKPEETEDINVTWGFSPRQTLALETLEDVETKEALYGGAKGGGKSVFLCRWVYLQCLKLIDFFGLENKLEYPLPVGFIGRKRATDFNKTTLETWKKFVNPGLYRLREHDKEIIIHDKVKVVYGGMDDQKTVNKFNSAEYAFIALDQAEELVRTELALLKGTLRLTYNNCQPKYKTLLTANPAPCFLRTDYIEHPEKGRVFIQALPADNPYLPDDYVNTLTDAFKHRPELVEAYVHGSWDQLEGSDILIKHQWVLANVANVIHDNNDRRVTVCDVARYGNDETVIYNMTDNEVKEDMIYGPKDTTITAANILHMAGKHNADLIAIDGDGMGGPVVDMVKKLLRDTDKITPVLEIRSGHRPIEDDKYVNARSEMWFWAAKMLAEERCCIPNDPVLHGQLTSVKYDPNGAGGKFGIEKKAETKKRLESSPDRADAFIYGLWATRSVEKKKYDYRRGQIINMPQRGGYGWEQQQLVGA